MERAKVQGKRIIDIGWTNEMYVQQKGYPLQRVKQAPQLSFLYLPAQKALSLAGENKSDFVHGFSADGESL